MSTEAADVRRPTDPRRPRSLPTSSVWLLLGKGLQMGSGFVFWVVAARSSSVVDVGLAAAFASAVMLCTQLGILGTGSAAIVGLARGQQHHQVVDAALTIVAVAASAAAGGYLVLSHLAGGDQLAATRTVGYAALFVLAAVTGTAVICLDQVSIGLHRTEGAATRYLVGGVLALALVSVAAATARPVSAVTLMGCWAVGSAAAVVVGLLQLRRWVGYRYRPTRHLGRLRSMLRVGLPNQMLTLTERLPPALVPIILAHAVSPTMTAYWYPAWMMVWVAFTAPISVGMVQFAQLVGHPERTGRLIRSGFTWSLLLGGTLCLVLVGGAGVFLRLLGAEYADASVTALRVLAAGLLPFVVLQAYNAVCRARDRVIEASALGAVLTLGICVGTAVSGHHGTTAVATTWLGCTSAAGAWATWRLVRLLRRRPAPPGARDASDAGAAASG